ncbi:hypothetical protein FEF22_001980 [Texas Phoenix palm phytoplasma]|uniref:Uncharacterized protein n=1 Tax=Texas Phoenix palm phytoplasma TaxID=176709 RepID=A0ABS5BIZ1_9MOLU|nr:hypothetical protein [Texas Phoenix palm phytoplasma]MBP3059542.1 hypothetical protein [Texas Phoenix palm phytoplasma]
MDSVEVQTILNSYPILTKSIVSALIFMLICFSGPIIIIFLTLIKKTIELIYRIFIFNLSYIFPHINNEKEKVDNELNIDKNNMQKDNNFSNDKNNQNLTLIEMKILELENKEYKNQFHQHNLFKLELNQHKIENKLELNEQKYYFETKRLENQITSLEKELDKVKQTKKYENYFCENENNKFMNKNKDNEFFQEKIDFDFIDEALKKQIPGSLKKIFDRIENLENIQLFILNNIMNVDSYYDSNKHALYIRPKDFIFVKNFLIDKQREQKKLN